MKGLARLWRRRPMAAERAYFDATYYQHLYPDVAAMGVDGFAHFMAHGWMEGRNPSATFVTLYYRDKHLDGQRLNPLTHYVAAGVRQGLRTAPETESDYISLQIPIVRPHFSEPFYRSQVIGVERDAIQYYLHVGWRDQVAPSPSFDAHAYVAAHAYVKRLDICPLYHFASQQRFWSRKDTIELQAMRQTYKSNLREDAAIRDLVAARFDAGFYLLENRDVQASGADPLDHFLEYGWRENRMPTRSFDCAYYCEQNPEVAESGINPFHHYLAIGEREGRRQNPIGRAPYPPLRAPPDQDWDVVSPACHADAAECIVIMPAYKGHDETLASIHAILAAPQRTPFALLVINDCSPDRDLVAALDTLRQRRLFLYESNDVNLGFLRTVNSGLRRFADKDVVLVNTDTQVFGDWLDRLLAHARRDPTIATITPFSNNATIFGYPLRNTNNTIEMEVDAAGLDRLAAACNAGRSSEVPVGVGFCLYMSAASRAAVGLLDEETFGRGYGDENDFCIRASRAGFRNVIAEDVFVYHVGEVSFGVPQDKRRVRGQKELIAKHPDHPDLISRHLDSDTTEQGRIRLDLRRLATEAAPSPIVHVVHALTGGIATHVDEQVRQDLADGRKSVILRAAVGDRWGLEIKSASPDAPYCPNIRSLSVLQFRSQLLEFFGWLAPAEIRIHSLVGLDWRATTGVFDLVADSGVPYSFTLHDYAPFCHRNNLVTPSGRYCGLPDVDTCRTCVASDRSYPEAVDPRVRRDAYARFLSSATRVLAPSRDIKARFEAHDVPYAIEVRAHAPYMPRVPIYEIPAHPEKLSVVTPGAIGFHKGSRIILNLARDAKARDLPIRFGIVGYSDVPGEMEAADVVETGRYADLDEAFAQIMSAKPSYIFLPSIWPETFSYTLSIAFALRCPPIVFDIGAPAERVRDEGFGLILPYDLAFNVKALNNRLLELHDLA